MGKITQEEEEEEEWEKVVIAMSETREEKTGNDEAGILPGTIV